MEFSVFNLLSIITIVLASSPSKVIGIVTESVDEINGEAFNLIGPRFKSEDEGNTVAQRDKRYVLFPQFTVMQVLITVKNSTGTFPVCQKALESSTS